MVTPVDAAETGPGEEWHRFIVDASSVVAESKADRTLGWRRHWAWSKWLLATVLLMIVFWRHREGLLNVTQQHLHWPSLLTAFALCGGSILLTFVRWYWLVKALGFAFTPRDALRLGFLGYLFNFVAPGSVGGDLVKGALLAKEQSGRRATAVATVLLDRILGMLALFVIGAGAACLQWNDLRHRTELTAIVGLLVFGSVAGLIGLGMMMIPAVMRLHVWGRLERLPLVGHVIAELVEGVRQYQTHFRVLLVALGMSIIGHFGMITSFYFSAHAVSGTKFVPPYAQHLFFIPAAELAGIVPLTPGGVGLLEEAVSSLYKLNGAAAGTGLLTCLVYRAVTLAVALVGVGYYVTSRREIDEALQLEADSSGEPVTSAESRGLRPTQNGLVASEASFHAGERGSG